MFLTICVVVDCANGVDEFVYIFYFCFICHDVCKKLVEVAIRIAVGATSLVKATFLLTARLFERRGIRRIIFGFPVAFGIFGI